MKLKSLENEIGKDNLDRFLIKIFCSIPQYNNYLRYDMKNVEPDACTPLSRYAVTNRLQFAERLTKKCLDLRISPFETVILEEEGVARIIIPPVIEARNDGIFIMDGIHRILSARILKLKNISCVSVNGDELPDLPCKPGSWDELHVLDNTMSSEMKFPGLNRSLFRPLTKTFNSSEFIFDNCKEALNYALMHM